MILSNSSWTAWFGLVPAIKQTGTDPNRAILPATKKLKPLGRGQKGADRKALGVSLCTLQKCNLHATTHPCSAPNTGLNVHVLGLLSEPIEVLPNPDTWGIHSVCTLDPINLSQSDPPHSTVVNVK